MKKIILMLIIFSFFIAGCSGEDQAVKHKYTDSFFDTFDTLVRVVAYADSDEEYDQYLEQIHHRYMELHRLYDIYLDYEGINNLKTVNDNAGVKPVEVGPEIIDLILFSKEMYSRTGGITNIAMGPVLKIWHHYRSEADYDPAGARVPPLEDLVEASRYTDLDQVIVDAEKNTVFLTDPRMSLDVGAVAKGFATEIVAKEIEAAGLTSGVISAGGNVRLIGTPPEKERDRWGIGVQDPDASIFGGEEKLLDVIYLESGSVDTSGDYQRYYVVDGKAYHHLIDPRTLMPAEHFRVVTVVADSAAVADFMSTSLFLVPFEQSYALAESMNNFEALWIFPDGKMEMTDGMSEMLKSSGAGGSNAD
ncbi:MAG: FAD:protein FMN transferase [Bacillota bacterium]|nr:FAD:protein FMN transferase [Bacillota bacterium]